MMSPGIGPEIYPLILGQFRHFQVIQVQPLITVLIRDHSYIALQCWIRIR